MERKEILLGKSLVELQQLCAELGFPKFAAKQIALWLYGKKVRSLDAMTDLSAKNRLLLAEHAEIGCAEPLSSQTSQDGTRKFLFATAATQATQGIQGSQGTEKAASKSIESVYIPETDRATLCVSCQSGCKMNCGFCATGSQGFNHSLQVHEILNQYYSIPETDAVKNIVYMGMGEPFDNIDAVLKSLEVMTSPWGFAWSPYRITVSTVGILPGMKRFLDESACHLALSLHNPFHEERAELMPMEKAYPVAEAVDLLRRYDWHGQRRVSFEYILMKDYNDSPLHAKAVAKLLRGLTCRVNLIAYHEVPGKPFRKTGPERTARFQEILQENGIICTLRRSRGEDIMAACGLLAKTGETAGR